jgi:hypothetical protein
MTATPAEPVAAPAATGALTGARKNALIAFIFLSGLLILGIWLAFLLAGHGVFGLNHHNLNTSKGGKALDKQTILDAHRAIGSLLGIVALLTLIAAAVARPGKKIIYLMAVLFLLIGIGQPLLAGIGEDHSWVGGLHVLNAGIILILAFWVHLAARKVPRA